MRKIGRGSLVLWLGLGLCCPGATPGDERSESLWVVRIGDGLEPITKGSASAVFLDAIRPATGEVVRSIPLPTEPGPSGRRFTLSSTATSEGQLACSGDGRYLTLAGYDAPLRTPKLPGSSTEAVPRVVARVDASGRVDTSTIVDGYSKNNIRGAVTVDGLRFFVSGAGEGGGARVVEFGSRAPSRLLSPSPTNTRGVAVFEGQLYVSVGSGDAKGVLAIGRGLPLEEGQTSSMIAPAPAGPASTPTTTPAPEPAVPASALPEPKPTGFVFLADTLYVADLDSGLLVYGREATEGEGPGRYRLEAKHPLPGLAFLAGRVVAGRPLLYGTDGERLLRISFEGSGLRAVEVARSGPNRLFRGVAFGPTLVDAPSIPPSSVPLPAVVALGVVGLGLPASAIFALRRKARRRVRFDGTDILIEGGPIGPD